MTRHDLQIKVLENLGVVERMNGFRIAEVQPHLVINPFFKKFRKCKSRAAQHKLIRAELSKIGKEIRGEMAAK